MKIAIACGGTGGHVFPGMAVGEQLLSSGHEPTILSTGRDVEVASLKEWDGELRTIGLRNYGRSNRLSKIFQLVASCYRSRAAIKDIGAEVILAMGGYASLGPVIAAKSLGVPVVLHEGNAVPGRAFRFLLSRATSVTLNFESTVDQVKKDAMAVGFPIRQKLVKAAKEQRKPNDAFCILVIGGSQGARFLNEVVPDLVKRLVDAGHNLRILHVAGEIDMESVERSYAGVRADIQVYGFINDMAPIYQQADAAISRSGASVCAELAAFGIPSMLIPFPFAAADHQTANAKHYSDGGAVELVAQRDFSLSQGSAFIESLITSESHLSAMRERMLACARIDAARDLADAVLSAGGDGSADI